MESMWSARGERPVYVISVAAELAGMHAQTLRQYDRLGLVTPSRTRGGGRRYSDADVERLREVQRLSQDEGISLAGVQRIMELENKNAAMRQRLGELQAEVEQLRGQVHPARQRVFAAGRFGEVESVRAGRQPARGRASTALVLWQPPGRS